MPVSMQYHHDPPDITEPWQVQSQYPIVRVDGDIQEGLKYDLLRLFIPCGEFSAADSKPVGFYRWMRTILSVTLFVSKNKEVVYSSDHRFFQDIYKLYLAGATRVYFVWELFANTKKQSIFYITDLHAQAVHRAVIGTSQGEEDAVFVPGARRRPLPPKDEEGTPNATWLCRTMSLQSFSHEKPVNPRVLAKRTHHGKPDAVPHPGWPVAPVL
jgi:hypothetical protein